ncbi:hypothetical protein ACFQHV_12245 [Promicromonospora thailandica]|uniref:Uncharacterized protein n=1 Tax=Promicromonospora thailandica TaxID=765201 RepID=A0A9X2JVK4_9MICO|nr:hypothetical protein [Promicromonospora thailandica]MCP2265156.1 hypothetical protein [Promicromonospora thailandica]
MARLVDPGARLPAWPFRSTEGQVDICEYNEFSDDEFASALKVLAHAHGDERISLVVVDPDPEEYHIRDHGHFPCFTVPTAEIEASYWDAVSFEPNDDPGAAILYADAFAIFGDSGRWSVWGQRDWEVVVVHADGLTRPWTEGADLFVSPEDAVARFVQPALAGSRWSQEDADRFVARMSDPQAR